ncbi:hypothetical protein HZ326_14478 [Fusarium oxysporum f. sp. albedinis]|nr:hypothetical protein HZ326_14478 [Fusarium oxysporum f. sp. albedinis]
MFLKALLRKYGPHQPGVGEGTWINGNRGSDSAKQKSNRPKLRHHEIQVVKYIPSESQPTAEVSSTSRIACLQTRVSWDGFDGTEQGIPPNGEWEVGDNKHICPSCGACHHPAAQRPRDRADAAVIGGCLIRSRQSSERVISAALPSLSTTYGYCRWIKRQRSVWTPRRADSVVMLTSIACWLRASLSLKDTESPVCLPV